MKKNKIFSFKNTIYFIDDCLWESNRIKQNIGKRGSIEQRLFNSKKDILRIKKLSILEQTLKFFEDRAKFIKFAISANNKDIDIGILRTLLRGLIEIYCKVIYLAVDERNIKYFIWEELQVLAKVSNYIDRETHNKSIKMGYDVLNYLNIKLPCHVDLFKHFINHFETLGNNQIIKSYNEGKRKVEKMKFPGIANIIKNHYKNDCKPNFSKEVLYNLYSDFSSQIHAGLFYEGYPSGTEKYQILGFLIIIYLKFSLKVSAILEIDTKNIQVLTENWDKNYHKDFYMLWEKHREIIEK